MAFLALRTADLLDSHTIHFARFQIVMEFLVNAVEFVAIASRVTEVDLGRTVAVDTPAHAEFGELLHFVHFLDGSVAGLALNLTGLGMLGVAEEYVVGEVVDLYPFYRLSVSCVVAAGFGIVAGVGVQFVDLGGSVDFAAVFAVQLGTVGVVVDRCMTVHTNVQRRYGSVFGIQCVAVAIQTAHLVDPGVYLV